MVTALARTGGEHVEPDVDDVVGTVGEEVEGLESVVGRGVWTAALGAHIDSDRPPFFAVTALTTSTRFCVLASEEAESEEDGAFGMEAGTGLGNVLAGGALVGTRTVEGSDWEVDEGGEPEELTEEDTFPVSLAAMLLGAHIEACKPLFFGIALETS